MPVWLGSTALPADDPADIKEWPVPWENSRPRDPYVDGKGRVWFVGQQGNYLAHFDPKTGAFERYELEPGTGPHNLIVDADGHVWYAGNRNAHIGRLDPETRKITRYPMPDPAVRDPHTLIFDRNGDIWFTSQGGNRVGKLTRTTGEIRLIAPATPGARPYGIVIDSKNRPWIVLFGTNKLATVDPATMTLREIALPREGTRPRRIAVTSDDRIWYTDYAGGFLGRYDPATGKVQEWKAPGGDGARPYALVNDDRDRLWFVETGLRPNRFVGFDPKTETFFSLTQIASGGGAVRHMFFLAQAHEIWFGTDTNTIGRARIP
ncbi:MAG: lyase [Gemmatimonadetes bacterium]|nr:lyase [Gemmatimonadota bacterium]